MILPLATQLRAAGLPDPEPEHAFHPERGWRFDFAWPGRLVACEIDGGGHVRGRHHRPAGYEADCRKLNEAALAGWLVLRFTPAMVASGEALAALTRALGG